MQDRPSASELIDAVRGFLEHEIAPSLRDHRLRFRTLVAMNALGIVDREMKLVDEALSGEYERPLSLLGLVESRPEVTAALRKRVLELNRELAGHIRSGHVPDETLDHVRQTVRDKLRVASPKYLEGYK